MTNRMIEVHRPTHVGWDTAALPNERTTAEGELAQQAGLAREDPGAPPRRAPGEPAVEALRAPRRANNGVRGLEVCEPDELQRIARIYRRDGFCVVKGLLDDGQLARFRDGCARAITAILAHQGADGRAHVHETGRLPHRYSFGSSSASRQMSHDHAWAEMVDLPTTTPILREIFGGDDYLVWGMGGDLCLPGAIEYQQLHTDGGDPQHPSEERLQNAERAAAGGAAAAAAPTPNQFHKVGNTGAGGGAVDRSVPGLRRAMELTPPLVTINFVMSDLTWENGPIRQIPGSHTSLQPIPRAADEPEWMRLSALVGAPAGAGVFRDNRCWHGPTSRGRVCH
jgi:hypothetical protein